MFQELVLINRKSIDGELELQDAFMHSGSWLILKTCMRTIALGPQSESKIWKMKNSDQIYENHAAYQFLLEVVSGLHSSLIGETEIMGQFKLAATNYQIPHSYFGLEVKKMIQGIYEDVKKVRSKFLVDLGSQSYGSILRKECRKNSIPEIHIIGAGHLCEEILPWVSKDSIQVHIHVRDVQKSKQKFQDHKIQWHQIGTYPLSGAVIVAAPMKLTDLVDLLKMQKNQIQYLYDLRRESDVELPELSGMFSIPVFALSLFTSLLNENLDFIQERKSQAILAIENLAVERSKGVEHRPFGWEDMIA